MGDGAVLPALFDLLQENTSVGPGNGKRRDRGDVRSIGTSAILVRGIARSGRVAIRAQAQPQMNARLMLALTQGKQIGTACFPSALSSGCEPVRTGTCQICR